MSVPVELEALQAELTKRSRPAYLVTAGDDGPPHLVSAYLRWSDGAFETGCGNTSARNLAVRPEASVVVPPDDVGDYSLIFDATAEVIDGPERVVRLTPTKAVLHRPAASPDDAGACGHDCAPLS